MPFIVLIELPVKKTLNFIASFLKTKHGSIVPKLIRTKLKLLDCREENLAHKESVMKVISIAI